jgi:hypothetical protein
MMNKFAKKISLLTILSLAFIHIGFPLSRDVFIKQGTVLFSLSPESKSHTLKRDSFTLYFYALPYNEKQEEYNSMRIAFLNDENAMEAVMAHTPVDSIPYFSGGTGFAGYDSAEYDYFMPSNEGHYYIFWENEKNRRATWIKQDSTSLQLSWTVNGVLDYANQHITPLKKHKGHL